MPDNTKGLWHDFSDEAVNARMTNWSSGLPPHERPGHRAPDQPTDRDLSAKAGIEAVRLFDLDDGIEHT